MSYQSHSSSSNGVTRRLTRSEEEEKAESEGLEMLNQLEPFIFLAKTMDSKDNQNVSKPRNSRVTRPKVVYQWTLQDVQQWLSRHCGKDYFEEHGEKFLEHEITGRALIRLTVDHLYRMGIKDPDHAQHIYRQIVRLRLKTRILEVKDLERND